MIGPALLLVAALVQATLSPYIKVNGVHPDLVLLLVVGWTSLRGLEEGAVWALIGGICLDFLSGAPFGVFSVTLLAAAVVTGLFHGRMFGSSIVLPVFLTFPLSFLFNGGALLLLSFLGHPVNWNSAVTFILLPLAIFNTVLMVAAFPLLHLLNRWLYPQPITF